MGSDYPCTLSLSCLSWEPGGRTVVPSYHEIVTPSYAKALTTISELALVCGLSLSDVLKAGALGGATLMPYAPTQGFSLQRIDREKLNDGIIEEGLRESGPDWLGRYHYSSEIPEKIELHLSRCRRVAKFLGVPARHLVEVVWTHEAAHFVSHIGIGGYCHSIWEDFSNASSDHKEYIAQAICWGTFSVFARSDLIEVMEKLAIHQSPKYNAWRSFEKKCRDKDPLQIIAELTLEVGRVSGRKVVAGREDIHDILGYDD